MFGLLNAVALVRVVRCSRLPWRKALDVLREAVAAAVGVQLLVGAHRGGALVMALLQASGWAGGALLIAPAWRAAEVEDETARFAMRLSPLVTVACARYPAGQGISAWFTMNLLTRARHE